MQLKNTSLSWSASTSLTDIVDIGVQKERAQKSGFCSDDVPEQVTRAVKISSIECKTEEVNLSAAVAASLVVDGLCVFHLRRKLSKSKNFAKTFDTAIT